ARVLGDHRAAGGTGHYRGDDSGFCARAGRIRRHHHGGRQYPRADFDIVARDFSIRAIGPGQPRLSALGCFGGTRIRRGRGQRVSRSPEMGAVMKLLLQRICLPLKEFTRDVDVGIQSKVTSIFGPSGAGTTSLLDLVAGLPRPKSALIQLSDRVLTDTARGWNISARSREIGYVPQNLTLFPHLSVRGNLLFGYRAASNSLFRFEHVIDVLEIQPLLPRGVTDLSGGEKQRVALARALLTAPRLVLLDEPLASLDQKLKAKIIPYLCRVRDEFDLPMLYVTHDQAEAAALCDEVLVMESGRFVRQGKPDAIFVDYPMSLSAEGYSRRLEGLQSGENRQFSDD